MPDQNSQGAGQSQEGKCSPYPEGKLWAICQQMQQETDCILFQW